MIKKLHGFIFIDILNGEKDLSIREPSEKVKVGDELESIEEMKSEIKKVISEINIDQAMQLRRLCTVYYEKKG